jgi:hypothetical protein
MDCNNYSKGRTPLPLLNDLIRSPGDADTVNFAFTRMGLVFSVPRGHAGHSTGRPPPLSTRWRPSGPWWLADHRHPVKRCKFALATALTIAGCYSAVLLLYFAHHSSGWLLIAVGLPIAVGIVWLYSDLVGYN